MGRPPSPRGRRAVAGLVVVLVAACASNDDPTVEAGPEPPPVSVPAPPLTTFPPASVEAPAAPVEVPAMPAPVPPSVGSPAPVAPPPDAAPAPQPAPTPAPGPGPAALAFPSAMVAPGRFAGAVLRPDMAARVVVEIHVQAGAEPGRAALDHLSAVLGEVVAAPLALAGGGAVPGGGRAWTSEELRATADAGATTAQGAGRAAVLRILFLRGTFEGDGGVLGVAVRGDVAAVFVDQVRAAGGFDPAAVERAVLVHEVGHLLGLVDLWRNTGRAPADRPGHSSNRASVMHFAVESSLIGSVLGARPPDRFDAADRADLAAIASGAPPG